MGMTRALAAALLLCSALGTSARAQTTHNGMLINGPTITGGSMGGTAVDGALVGGQTLATVFLGLKPGGPSGLAKLDSRGFIISTQYGDITGASLGGNDLATLIANLSPLSDFAQGTVTVSGTPQKLGPYLATLAQGNSQAISGTVTTLQTVNGPLTVAGAIVAPSIALPGGDSLAAAGIDQSSATQLVGTVYRATSCLFGGFVLPAGPPARSSYAVTFMNQSGNPCTLYPGIGAAIDQNGLNNPVTIADATDATFRAIGPAVWYRSARPAVVPGPSGQVVTSGSAATMLAASNLIVIQKPAPGSATIVNLPPNPAPWVPYTIKDGAGDADVNPITITPASGLIDNASTAVLATPSKAISVEFTGLNWIILQ